MAGPSILANNRAQTLANNRARTLVCVAALIMVVVFVSLIGRAQPRSTNTTSKPTNWVVTVTAQKGKTEAVTYSVAASPDASQGGCSTAAPPNIGETTTGDVPMCPNDTIQWQGSSEGKSHEMVVFVSDQILSNTTFRGTDGGVTTSGSLTTSGASNVGDHEYYIVLYDKKNKQVHEGDPKIIIGTTGLSPEGLVENIAMKAKQLLQLRPDNPEVKRLWAAVDALQKSNSLK